MRLSTKGRYGSRLMVDLALKYGHGPIMLRDIAERQKVSKKYLEQIIIMLKARGLVKSIRGAKGGYKLNRHPSKIRMIDIINAVKEPVWVVKCVNNPDSCSWSEICVTRDLWAQVSNDIVRRLSSITLERLVQAKKKKEK